MRSVGRSALVPYAGHEMFTLVDTVEDYPDFLPWCHSVTVHERTHEFVEATLDARKGAISKSFTTRNMRREFESIELQLIEGPFRHLAGTWTFLQLGDEGSKVSLEMEFEFESTLVDLMFGTFFEETCNSLVDSFSRRAESVYGAR